ncbi:DNA integrity scanning protein DisA nucleotide-binding domain protein [Blastopirellula retiformator]|uniref:DNA integrity scanning protein DisA n=1 Tax=Blastopirellula retiformator TaxID=2527970 RepID=A0A5C5V1G0_9BACT|nr:DNA integrity scanning protein DisA nucleotide-binding domain protein [Blastopirellula retiformator]TWT31572.1 DNA integrity scanning protein DisA [Blastopirellula retiformator]
MKQQKFTKQFAEFLRIGAALVKQAEADALLIFVEGVCEWEQIKAGAGNAKTIVAADDEEALEGAKETGLMPIVVELDESPILEKLTHALVESVADDIIATGASVVALYSGFDESRIDTISLVRLSEHLGRLTSRDLRRLETSVPLETLKHVIDLAVDIGREGREGKPVGTMFVVGDHRKVLHHSVASGFDPIKGYNRKERSIFDNRVREGLKEIAQLDGAFIINADGVVEAACRLVDVSSASVTLSKGLGARHWAGAAISKKTKSIAIVVSESNGTVRVFQNGEVMLRIEPFRRAMKWKDLDFDNAGE